MACYKRYYGVFRTLLGTYIIWSLRKLKYIGTSLRWHKFNIKRFQNTHSVTHEDLSKLSRLYPRMVGRHNWSPLYRAILAYNFRFTNMYQPSHSPIERALESSLAMMTTYLTFPELLKKSKILVATRNCMLIISSFPRAYSKLVQGIRLVQADWLLYRSSQFWKYSKIKDKNG